MPEPESATSGDKIIGFLCALLVIVLFSGFTLISRLGLSSSLTPPDLAMLRFGIGGTLLMPVFLRHGLSGIGWRDALSLTFLGGLGFAGLAYTGFLLAPAAHGAVLLHGTLAVVAILSALASQPRSGPQVVGTGLIAMGILLMIADSASQVTLWQLVGDGCLLAASFCWSAYGVLARRLSLAPVRAAAIVAVLSMGGFVPLYFLYPGKMLTSADSREVVVQAVFQGVLIGAASVFVYTRAVAALGAAQTALFTAAVPVVATLSALPLLAETPSAIAICGVVIVTVGMVVALRRAERHEKSRRSSSWPCARLPASRMYPTLDLASRVGLSSCSGRQCFA